jgi:hypothetical protein
MTIRFNIHHVTDGQTKARVWYSLDNHVSQKPTVTLYSRDYSRALGTLIPDGYKNDTDLQSDYFDKGQVTLQEGHPLYAAARAAGEAAKAANSARSEKRMERARNPQPADPSTVEITRDVQRDDGVSARYFDIVSGGLGVHIVLGTGSYKSCRVVIENASHRAFRGLGKSYHSIAEAKRNYRNPKVLAAFVAVEERISGALGCPCPEPQRTRMHVKADCVEVVS